MMGNSASNKRASCRGLQSQCRLLPVAAAAWFLLSVPTPGSSQQWPPPVPPHQCLPRPSPGALQFTAGTASPGFLIPSACSSGSLVLDIITCTESDPLYCSSKRQFSKKKKRKNSGEASPHEESWLSHLVAQFRPRPVNSP